MKRLFALFLLLGSPGALFAADLFSGDLSRQAGWAYTKGAEADVRRGVVRFRGEVKRGSCFATYRTAADVSGGGVARISFDAGWTNVTPDEPSYSCAGLVMLVEYTDSKGRKVRPKNVNIGFGSREKTRYEMVFPVEKGAKDFSVAFGIRWARGEAEMGGFKMSLQTPAPENVRKGSVAGAVDAAIVNAENEGRRLSAEADVAESYLLDNMPPPAYPRPKVSGGGFAFFRVDSPRRTLDRHYPHESQLADTFSLQATPGETALLFFGAYAQDETKGLRAVLGELEADVTAGAGRGRLVCEKGLFRAHNWRRGFRRSAAYTYQPEVLFPLERAQNLPRGTSALFMAKFAVPEDAKAGDYVAKIRFSADGSERVAVVRLRVLPFKLRRPRPEEYEFIVHGGPYTAKAGCEKLKELYRAMKRRGFESALVPCQYAPGMLELEKTSGGALRIKSFKKLDDALEAYRASGMTGTLFVHFSDKLEVAVARALGIKMADGIGEQTGMIAEMDGERFKSATVEALRLVAERCRGVPFAVLGFDEPNVASRIPRARWEIERIEESGIASALYCSAEAWKNVPSKIAIASVFPGSVPCENLAKGVGARGGRLYLYAYEGSYTYAFGGMHDSWGGVMPSRFTLGLSEVLTPVSTGHTAWLFGTGGVVSEDDETAPKGWAEVTRYDANSRLLTTLQLEGECLGVDDYAYFNTLDKLLGEKRSHPEHARVSAALAALLERVRKNSYPYCLDSADAEVVRSGRFKSFVNSDADAVRAEVVELILKLL